MVIKIERGVKYCYPKQRLYSIVHMGFALRDSPTANCWDTFAWMGKAV